MSEIIERIGALARHGVFEFDTNAVRFNYFNSPFAEIFRLSESELRENPAVLLPAIFTEDFAYLQKMYETLREQKVIEPTEFRLNGGSLKHLLCEAYLVKDNLIVGFVKDISMDKEHDEYMVNYGAKKDTLLDMTAHNLSGPLHLTQNIISWMKEHYKQKIPAEIGEPLHFIEATTQECIEIVNDFLREEHLVSEKIFVKKTRFNLMEKLVAVIDKLAITNRNKKFRLLTEVEKLNVNTDSVKFFQAVHNLISNSVKFTQDGGQIDILVKENPETIEISVRDNGIGIPMDLFERMFMKHEGRRGLKNEVSRGLGLHIVKMLVELLDGKVSFESKEGIGSTFTMEIPKD